MRNEANPALQENAPPASRPRTLELNTLDPQKRVMSTLNKSAAIATIIGTVIAAAAFIYQLSDDKRPVVQVANSPVGLPLVSSKQPDTGSSGLKATSDSTTAQMTAAGQTAHGFDDRIEAAMLMNIYSNKAKALQRISEDASNAGDYDSAIRAAREIEIYSSKDAALAYIARKALSAGKKDVAIEAAKLMEVYSSKDTILSEIAIKQ